MSLSCTCFGTQGDNFPFPCVSPHRRSGYQVFLKFLQTELSSESALFWKHVDQLEDQCALWLMATPTRRKSVPKSGNKISNTQQLQQLLQIPLPASGGGGYDEVTLVTPFCSEESVIDEKGSSPPPSPFLHNLSLPSQLPKPRKWILICPPVESRLLILLLPSVILKTIQFPLLLPIRTSHNATHINTKKRLYRIWSHCWSCVRR